MMLEEKMAQTLQDLLDEARRRRDRGATLDALKVYRLVLEAAPLDFELRMEIGDLLATISTREVPELVYKAVAEHDIKAGNPLSAMVALKLLSHNPMIAAPLVAALQDKYCVGSKVLGRSVKQAPSDYTLKIRENIDINYPIEKNAFVLQTVRMAASVDVIKNYPSLVPPVPIFSTLDPVAFGELFQHLKLRRFKKGASIVKQGETGHAVYFIARGDVDIRQTRDGEEDVQLATLGPGTLFGEMALLSAEPRSASVVCLTDVDVLELNRDDVTALSNRMPQVAGAMNRFMRERLINNLLTTNPLFKPFDDSVKKQLLAKFKGHEVPAGTIFLEEGDAGRGLYIILQGKAEVTKQQKGETVHIALIGPGDIVGEMSLLGDRPVSATVCTKTPSTLLFLARELFMPLVQAVPALRDYFTALSENRFTDTEAKVAAKAIAEQAQEGEVLDVDEDMIVLF
jgi:CRP-like cAMP-binding protein